MYIYAAKKEGDLVRFQLKDPSNRIVADGTGATVSTAQQDALERTQHEGAQVHLGQVKYPEILTD